jgi:CRP/FNR family cyclic AMP-dependent transcriptional regulator
LKSGESYDRRNFYRLRCRCAQHCWLFDASDDTAAHCCDRLEHSFIIYSALAGIYPTLFLHLILLPLNAYRLREMMRLVKDVTEAAKGNLKLEWLRPFTHVRRYTSGEIVFRKGDVATNLAFVVRGKFKLIELNIELATGALIGELGLLAPGNLRTQTLQCVSDAELLVISYDEVRQLQVQNPHFGLYFLQVASSRMFQNMQKLEAELVQLRGY